MIKVSDFGLSQLVNEAEEEMDREGYLYLPSQLLPRMCTYTTSRTLCRILLNDCRVVLATWSFLLSTIIRVVSSQAYITSSLIVGIGLLLHSRRISMSDRIVQCVAFHLASLPSLPLLSDRIVQCLAFHLTNLPSFPLTTRSQSAASVDGPGGPADGQVHHQERRLELWRCHVGAFLRHADSICRCTGMCVCAHAWLRA